MNSQPFLVGITGGSASGKSSFAHDLKAQFPDEVLTILCEDNYYLPVDKVPVDKNGVQNFDTPDAIDSACYIDHVKKLKSGAAVQKEENHFHKKGAMPQMLTLQPTPIVVLEGIFSLHFDEVRDLVDLKLYIETDPDARLDRRRKRDVVERGLDLADVEYRWKNHITPSFERDHDEYKACADLIVLNNMNYELGLKIITAYLKGVLK